MRGYKARHRVVKERYQRTMLVRIQKFYRFRLRHKGRAAVVIQSVLKRYAVRKKIPSQLTLTQGIKLGDCQRKRQLMKAALLQFRAHSASIRLQKHCRQFLASKLIKRLKIQRAQYQFKDLLSKSLTSSRYLFLKQFKTAYVQRVILVQKHLRAYKAKKLLTQK